LDLLGGCELLFAAVLEDLAEWRVLVEVGGADHAGGALAGMAFADGDEVGALVGRGSDFSADEVLGRTVDALCWGNTVLLLQASVFLEHTRVQCRGPGFQIDCAVVNFQGICVGSVRDSVDQVFETAVACRTAVGCHDLILVRHPGADVALEGLSDWGCHRAGCLVAMSFCVSWKGSWWGMLMIEDECWDGRRLWFIRKLWVGGCGGREKVLRLQGTFVSSRARLSRHSPNHQSLDNCILTPLH